MKMDSNNTDNEEYELHGFKKVINKLSNGLDYLIEAMFQNLCLLDVLIDSMIAIMVAILGICIGDWSEVIYLMQIVSPVKILLSYLAFFLIYIGIYALIMKFEFTGFHVLVANHIAILSSLRYLIVDQQYKLFLWISRYVLLCVMIAFCHRILSKMVDKIKNEQCKQKERELVLAMTMYYLENEPENISYELVKDRNEKFHFGLDEEMMKRERKRDGSGKMAIKLLGVTAEEVVQAELDIKQKA